MESSYVSSQIKEFNRIRGTTTTPRKTTIGSIRMGTILGMTEEEIRKGARNQNAGQTLGSHKKEQEPSHTSTTRKPSGDTNDFEGFWRRRRV
jgi:Fic family protein